MERLRVRFRYLLTTAILAVLLLTAATPAFAFNGAGAAQYADYWAMRRNSNYPSYLADCANFASQSLHQGGGYSYMYAGNYVPFAWWVRWNPTWYGGYFTNSNSWSCANDLRNFLLLDWPGGWDWGLQPTNKNYNRALLGDLLFYDWESDGYYDHVAVEASYAAVDPNWPWYYGDVVDQHTNDRYHAMWDLWIYNNAHRWTTRVDLIHIDPSNR